MTWSLEITCAFDDTIYVSRTFAARSDIEDLALQGQRLIVVRRLGGFEVEIKNID